MIVYKAATSYSGGWAYFQGWAYFREITVQASPSSPPPLPPPMPSLASSPSYYVNQRLDLYPNSERIGQSQPLTSWSEVSPRKYTPPDVVISRYLKYKNQRDIGRLAVALAKYTYFGEEVMRRSTLTGTRNKDTIPLDPEKLKGLSKDIRAVFPSNLSEQEFTHIWG